MCLGGEFMDWISRNYEREKINLLSFHNSEDLINDAVLRVHKKLTGQQSRPFNFRGYLFLAFRNLVFVECKKKKRQIAPPRDYIFKPEEEREEFEKRVKREKLSEEVFKWVENNFEAIEAGLFKYYYKTDFTFIKLSELTGYSKSFIHQKVKEVREAVQNEFI